MKNTSAKKLSITIREDLLEKMDEYANGSGMSRSGLIAVAVKQYLSAAEAMQTAYEQLLRK